MTEETNFLCYVGTYEIWRGSDFPARAGKTLRESTAPLLVQVGPAQRIRPKQEAVDMAILRLLKTKIPKLRPLSRKQHVEMQADRLKLGDRAAAKWDQMYERETVGRADFTDIGNSALTVAGHLGMLGSGGGPDPIHAQGYNWCESLKWWVQLADEIQAMFYGREVRAKIPDDLVNRTWGQLDIVLAYGSSGASMHLLPRDTRSALIYRAAQMVAVGTKLQNCKYCNSPFLSGGEARGGGKRRRDASFCSDKCRWSHHNDAMRRKRKL